MFGLGFFEIAIVTLIAFLVFGPKQFPTVAKNFLQFLNELKSSFKQVKTELKDVESDAREYIDKIQEESQIKVLKDKILKEELSKTKPSNPDK